MIALNCGSGQRKFHSVEGVIDWINVDVNPKWEPDIIADCAKLDMFADGSVDLIVSHHCIEHVGLGEFDAAIREAWRVLRPGGSFIITTPDLRALTRAWLEGRISDYIFKVQLFGAYMNDEADRHKWANTSQSLAESVGTAARWTQLLPFDWRAIPGADIAKDWYILGLEAIK